MGGVIREASYSVFLYKVNQKIVYCPQTLSNDAEMNSFAENLTSRKTDFHVLQILRIKTLI